MWLDPSDERGLFHHFLRSNSSSLLKRPSLDLTMLDNFCLVSNLPFLGKVVNKVVMQQLQSDLDEADQLDHFQSGSRFGHGTETTLLMLLDDLWWQQDSGSTSDLTFLDLLVAFITIDHGKFLAWLHELRVGSAISCWFAFFLQY